MNAPQIKSPADRSKERWVIGYARRDGKWVPIYSNEGNGS